MNAKHLPDASVEEVPEVTAWAMRDLNPDLAHVSRLRPATASAHRRNSLGEHPLLR
jgi:hypothetical protein